MKKLKGLVVMFVALLMMGSTIWAASPTDELWEYEVYSSDGSKVDSGIINPFLRATWEGVTVGSGQTAVFKPAGSSGLIVTSGVELTIKCTLSRSASAKVALGTPSGNVTLKNGTFSSITHYYTTGSKGYYTGRVTNNSSSSFTVKSFSINQ